jgi:hypothetical protein
MTRRPIRPRDVKDPSRIASNLISDYIEGSLDDSISLYRVLVVEIDHEGSKWKDTEVAPNPPNSFKGRVLTRSRDKYTKEEDLPIFWPMFSHDVMPLKEGEHAYVIFEDEEKTHGIWLARIPEPDNVSKLNLTLGDEKFKENKVNKDLNAVGERKAVEDVDEKPKEPLKQSDEFVKEDLPKTFIPRVGDRVIHGSNNAMIVLGRDRPSDRESGEKENAGTIDIVVGRSKKDDMDFKEDAARIYISTRTDSDSGDLSPSLSKMGDNRGVSQTVALKSREVRIIGRNSMKIVVDGGKFDVKVPNSDAKIAAGGKVVIECDDIKLGDDPTATEGLVLGTTYRTQEDTFLQVLIDQLVAVLTALGADAAGAGTFLGIAGVNLPGTVGAAPAAATAIKAAHTAFKTAGAPLNNYVSTVSKTKK